jgi:hypothetical protein
MCKLCDRIPSAAATMGLLVLALLLIGASGSVRGDELGDLLSGTAADKAAPIDREIFEPLDFIARLAALVPKPRAHLSR